MALHVIETVIETLLPGSSVPFVALSVIESLLDDVAVNVSGPPPVFFTVSFCGASQVVKVRFLGLKLS